MKITGIDPATDVGDALSFFIDGTNRGPGDATAVKVNTDLKRTELRIEATGVRTSAASLSAIAQSANPDIVAIDNTAIAPLDVLASAPPTTESSGGGWLTPVLIGAAVLRVLGTAATLVLKRRRNRP